MSISFTNFTADLTSLASAQANILASSTEMVKRLNADLTHRYLSAYNDYVANMESGGFVPDERRTPPKPPNGWELAPADENGFVFYQIGTKPVCDPGPAVTYIGGNTLPVKTPNTIDIGKNICGKWYSVGPLDSFPAGMETPPQADGHTYEKFNAVVGAGWYLQVA